MSDQPVRVRVRGIYATASTAFFVDADGFDVVGPSPPIRERFDRSFDDPPADVRVETTADRLGVGVTGDPEAVDAVGRQLADVGVDTLAWADPTPIGTVFDAVLGETRGGGAVVDLGGPEGYLPFDAVDGYVETGDLVRVQVRESRPPWSDGRPELAGGVRVGNGVVTLERGRSGVRAEPDDEAGTELVRMTDLLSSTDAVPDDWGIRWRYGATDTDLDGMNAALSAATDRADPVETALADASSDPETRTETTDLPRRLVTPGAGRWIRFGRESRFALDERRRSVTDTMAGHHRLKAGSDRASDAVDFVEAVAPDADDGAEAESGTDFPFAAAYSTFGPAVGERVRIDHGKPDGRQFSLGRAAVTDRDPDGSVTLRREMRGSGEYDALGTPREPGDVALTRLKEGRWWYATAYRGANGEKKGTYVNVCTPVEVFPDAVSYVDLHVDVVRYPDGTVERVDDDELAAAEDRGDLSATLADKARSVADRLVGAL
jgi:hypothetical protein